MARPRARFMVYVVRPNEGMPYAFVPHPTEAGRWMRVHPCVAFVACPQCEVPAGMPCRFSQGFAVSEHCRRREALPRDWAKNLGPLTVADSAGELRALLPARRWADEDEVAP